MKIGIENSTGFAQSLTILRAVRLIWILIKNAVTISAGTEKTQDTLKNVPNIILIAVRYGAINLQFVVP